MAPYHQEDLAHFAINNHRSPIQITDHIALFDKSMRNCFK